MSYRCGIGPGFGVPPTEPTITCDGGCGESRVIRGRPPAWFLDNKPVPGWSLKRTNDETGVHRVDLCPKCKPKSNEGRR